MADSTIHLVARSSLISNCTSSTCPASESLYGYAPSLAPTWIFFAAFVILTLVFFFQSFQFPTWRYYALIVALGCALESLGYIARLLLHYDPFSKHGFEMSLALFSLAPAFFAAAIYMLFAELIKTFSRSLSILGPDRYTQMFVASEALSIILQIAGGAAAAAVSTRDAGKSANRVLVTGLVLQLVTFLVFGVVATYYLVRIIQKRDQVDRNGIRYVPVPSMALWSQGRFKRFLLSTTAAYMLILLRCCYRVHAFKAGWGNSVLRNEGLFTALESIALVAAVVHLAVYHPGRCMQLEGDNVSLLHEPVESKWTSSSASSFRTASPAPSATDRTRVPLPLLMNRSRSASPVPIPSPALNKEFGYGGRPRFPSYIAPRTSQILSSIPPPAPPTSFGPPSTSSRLKAWFSPWSTPGLQSRPQLPVRTPSNASHRSQASQKSTSTWTSTTSGAKIVSPMSATDAGGHSPSYPFPRLGAVSSRQHLSTTLQEPERAHRVTGSVSPVNHGVVSPIIRHQHALPKTDGYHVLSIQGASSVNAPAHAPAQPVMQQQQQQTTGTLHARHPLASKFTRPAVVGGQQPQLPQALLPQPQQQQRVLHSSNNNFSRPDFGVRNSTGAGADAGGASTNDSWV